MPYKDPEAKRRYMARHYQKKIKTGVIPCTAHRKESYGLTRSFANKIYKSGERCCHAISETRGKLAVEPYRRGLFPVCRPGLSRWRGGRYRVVNRERSGELT